MKKFLTIAAATTALALGATAAQAETRQERNEARLAEMIEGRVAGDPQSCITAIRSNRIQVIPYVGVVYDAGDTIYVARATRPERLRDWDVPIIERFGSQLCRQDVIRTVDRYSGFTTGALFLEDFVPYTKADAANG
ncbi:hypothetical protein [Alteraurantiacibacter aquimixticola]|uniref:Uncharacterized protein n=1 Tax=Alteraurantiacibacter aquimixticola TaxID=2489173 RepID=A0A4T3EYF8_9SPHN|nr:hypothetical protein [Alteraurantiacibacter aquimixticola]TIX48889.1 hypothetical protein E5222_14200 [Alteraurantiacibacter aquimixticola]